MPRIAIISDLHANLEALSAVLEDIESQSITHIVCLGDIIGYGPNPIECLRLMGKFSTTILGNHELALAEGGLRFNQRARAAIEWTLDELKGTKEGQDFLAKATALPTSHAANGILYVHGSPRDHTNEYLLPQMAERPDMKDMFALFDRYCFVGHTHMPGVMEPGRPFERPADMLMGIFMLPPDSKAVVNVGSVGQPRDRDPRACYVTFDGDSVVYRRVEYDIPKTVAKIKAIQRLSDYLGERLLEGK